MIRSCRRSRTGPARRGAVLLVVLGLLALFAVVGLGFVLLAESEATGARNYRSSRNEIADPDPAAAANGFLSQLLFGTSDPSAAAFGHDPARSRFGVAGIQSPFTGTGVPAESLTLSGLDFNGAPLPAPGITLDRRQVVNFRVAAGWGPVSPDFMSDTVTRINKAVPYTYPDRNNFWLAYYDPVTDTVTLPSFHRPDLFGSLAPTNIKWRNNGHASGGDSTGYYQTLRPRQGEHPNFPLVPANADGTYTGDVPNLKWLTGSVKNDSLWMDLGLPPRTWRGKQYKMLVAPLILDLGGRVNLSVAGNNRAGGANGSHHGWGSWEVNPTGLLNFPTNATSNPLDATAISQLQALMNLRYTGANVPPAPAPTSLDRFRNLSTGTLNGGFLPPPYSRIDADGWGTGAPDSMTLPGPNGFYPFPSYTTRYAGTQPLLTAELAATPGPHGQSFSPWQWPRRQAPLTNNPWVPGLEDQMRLLLRGGGPKGPSAMASQATPIFPNNKLTTLFNVSQRWGEMTVPINNAGGTARLVAIDITRPLPDYRMPIPATSPPAYAPLSPANMGNANSALLARQNLARDIFVRVLAGLGQIDGTNVTYDPISANVTIGYTATTPQFAGLRVLAQYAVNMVDQIDTDDISTLFAWNPSAPLDFVFGTELPKLVLNEVYCKLDNDRTEIATPPAMQNATKPQKVMFWVELHNPLASDPTLPDGGAARLQYQKNVSSVADPTTGNLIAYAGATYPVYQIDIAEVLGTSADKQPLSSMFDPTKPGGNPSNVLLDTVATPIPNATTRIRVGDYTYATTAPTTAAVLAGDELNVVRPADGLPGGLPANQGGNAGYYVLGPRDDFPGCQTTMRLEDDAVGGPAGPQNAMMYTPNMNPLDKATLLTQGQSTHVVVLRRLANPYLLAGPTNPYIIVDYMENVPTRDRAKYAKDNMGAPRPAPWMDSTSPSIGRRHPYAAAPAYGLATAPAQSAVLDQAPNPALGTSPQHTFFGASQPFDNTAGLAWLAHLDREPVNVLELLTTSMQSPAKLTQTFFNGIPSTPSTPYYPYQQHLLPPPGTGLLAATVVPLPFDPNYGGFVRVFDLLGVANRLPGVPLGGREPGRINVNAAMDNAAASDGAVLQTVFDPQSGNNFNSAFVTAGWGSVLPTRTPGNNGNGAYNLPAGTVQETGQPTGDRPFQPLANFQESLFRQGATPNFPAFFNSATSLHPYMQSEPLRKGWNNLTTVSDGFLVVFTVGFFEVNGAGQLGKELYDKVNGDLRAQYAGIIDRSAITLAIDPNTLAVQTPIVPVAPGIPVTPAPLGPKPWETKLVADSAVGSSQITIQARCPTGATTCIVYDDGVAVTIDPAVVTPTATTVRDLWVGYSMANPSTPGYAINPYPAGTADGDGEAVRVTQVQPNPLDPTGGTAILTVATISNGTDTNLRRFHGGGSRVSNAPVGHPGPQPGFDFREPTGRYRGVLPYFMRIVP